MSDREGEFEDPGLKRAVRRACGGEMAPAHLHQRVRDLFAAGATGAADQAASEPLASSGSRAFWRRPQLRTAAAAAVMLLAVGYMVVQVRSTLFPTRYQPTRATAATPASFPLTLAAEMARTHDHCAHLADHHFVGGNDFDAMRAQLSREEGFTVFAAGLRDGWQFKGAGLCAVGAARAAHLVFAKGDDTLSVFSMPAPASCGAAPAYEHALERHALVGFRSDGALYCVVGTCGKRSMSCREIEPVLAEVRLAVTGNACGGEPRDSDAPLHRQPREHLLTASAHRH